MVAGLRYKAFDVYKPVRLPVGSGGFKNTFAFVSSVQGTIKTASSQVQLVAQGNDQIVTHQAKVYNSHIQQIGIGYTDTTDAGIGDIGPDWAVVRNGHEYKVVSAQADDQFETPWIVLTLVLEKDLLKDV